MTDRSPAFHVMCERDVGLFSLVQQVIANVPWARSENRSPVAFFGRRTCYWLAQSQHLVHNGSSLARTVLLAVPGLPHTNVHQPPASEWRRLAATFWQSRTGVLP